MTPRAYHPLDLANLANLPASLRAGKCFVCWREAVRDGKATKIPVDPHNGKEAEADNPATWSTLVGALKYYHDHKGHLGGVGRMFDGTDGIMGIDFDDCLDQAGNIIGSHVAAEWLPQLNSYTEISPSTRGVKVWLKAGHQLEGKTGRRDSKIGVEVYRSRRYFTLTGRRLAQFSGEVEERQEIVAQFYNVIFGTKETAKAKSPATAIPSRSDAQIVDRASKAKNGAKFLALWQGKFEANGSQSEADAALCSMLYFWTGDREAVRRLFGQSALGQREKWKRPDYQESTLDLACRGETCTPRSKRKRTPPAAVATDQTTPEVEAYYDSTRGHYWIANSRKGWVSVNETSLRRWLRAAGVSARCPETEAVSPLEKKLIEVQHERDVDYAGPLAGFRIGIHTIQGRRVLVTESPRLIEPVPGKWPLLGKLIENLLVDQLCDQRPYFFGWLKIAVEALMQNQLRPGQALGMAGPHDCGKSLLQNVITSVLGGRMAKPYQFMTGGTAFNADMFGAEHQMIEDEAASTDIRARRNFGANLKNVTVNEVQRCHAKNRTPLSLTPFWRLTITVNDEAENLMVLPPIDDSIEDKLILFKAHKKPMPARTATGPERTAFWNALTAELPAFVAFLLKYEIPVELQSERFGINHYHHPDILRAIDDLAPEKRLLTLIDGEVFKVNTPLEWHGTAEELEKLLTDREASTSYAARQLFTFNTAAGVYLGRLAKKMPQRFSERRVHGQRQWAIKPPSDLVEGCEGISYSNEERINNKEPVRESVQGSAKEETPCHPATTKEPALTI